MPYRLIEWDTYPGSGLPVYRVYDAEEYNDPTVRAPRHIGEVWGVGTPGVLGRFIATGVRWQLTGAGMTEGELIERGDFPTPARYAEAARAMIAAYEAAADAA